LVGLLGILLVFYVMQKKKEKGRDKESLSQLETSLPPLKLPKSNKVFKLFFYGAILLSGFIALSFMAHVATGEGKPPVEFLVAALVILMGLLVLIVFMMFMAIRKEIFLPNILKKKDKAAKKALLLIPGIMGEGEVIQSYLMAIERHKKAEKTTRDWIAARMGDLVQLLFLPFFIFWKVRKESPLSGTIILVTNRRIILLRTDMSRKRLKDLRQIAYAKIHSLGIRPHTKRSLMGRPAPQGEFLDIKFTSDEVFTLLASRFELEGFCGKVEQILKEGSPQWTRPHALDVERVCPSCYRILDPHLAYCNLCYLGKKMRSPKRAAILSLIYPGLGQFYNGSLWKGVLFMTVHTILLFASAVLGISWYSQYAEVDPSSFMYTIAWLLAVWAMSVVDAYVDFTVGRE
jgi:hypothetical protein